MIGGNNSSEDGSLRVALRRAMNLFPTARAEAMSVTPADVLARS